MRFSKTIIYILVEMRSALIAGMKHFNVLTFNLFAVVRFLFKLNLFQCSGLCGVVVYLYITGLGKLLHVSGC